MSPLINALKQWPGRAYLEAKMVSRGFHVPKHYQARVKQECGQDEGQGLDRYWNEVAKEHFLSAGRCNPDRRSFLGESAYRSAYLDELSEAAAAASPRLPLDPCLRRFTSKVNTEPGFGAGITAVIEVRKLEEISLFGINPSKWTGERAAIASILKDLVEPKGFQRVGSFWIKKAASDLVFRCGIDLHGGKECGPTLPVVLEITHPADSTISYNLSFLNPLVPGFAYYTTYTSPKAAILGLSAHAELFDIIFDVCSVSPPRAPC